MNRNLIILLILLLSSGILCAQDDSFGPVKIKSSSPDDGLLYRSELVWGINFNTIGGLIGGLYLKKAKALNKRLYRSLSLEIVNVKHEKEVKEPVFSTGGNIVKDKRNYFYVIRPQYGREYVLFQKARKQGIQVNAIGAIGPTIGLMAPYLIEYNHAGDPSTSFNDIKVEQFDKNIHFQDNILGSGHFAESISQASIVPGVSLKMGLSFEMGTFKSSVSGFEAGFMIDAYSKDIEILQDAPTKNVFTSIYINFYYGSRK